MTVKINSSCVIRVESGTYNLIKTNQLNKLSITGVETGTRLIIKEHDGKRYTGSEVLATAKQVNDQEVTFKKIAITTDKKKGETGVMHLNKGVDM